MKEEEQPEEKVPEAMEEDEPEEEGDPKIHAPTLNMAEAKAKFAIAQAEQITEQQVILDSIRDETEVKANHRIIWQRQAGADALYDEFEVDIAAEEAAP
ncbi:hypothetical protein D1007_41259 [Hordeum vulgare]|nr:hypothetical protein D1007_41259 [Hordeum vulgare]